MYPNRQFFLFKLSKISIQNGQYFDLLTWPNFPLKLTKKNSFKLVNFLWPNRQKSFFQTINFFAKIFHYKWPLFSSPNRPKFLWPNSQNFSLNWPIFFAIQTLKNSSFKSFENWLRVVKKFNQIFTPSKI
jgi:hypothetical protein